jgi:purine-nucleoside phosphorylase
LLVAGKLSGVECVALQGRFHMYEGHSAQTAALPVRVMAALGADVLIVTNAAGGVHPRMRGGQLMLVTDHINFMFKNPLIGPVVPGDVRFPDMSAPYDRELRELALRVAKEQGTTLEQGVYVGLVGPSYETPAETRMFQFLGADAIGMSTVPEVLVARAMGLRVLGISLVTNAAGGADGEPVTHEEVMAAAAAAAPKFSALVKGIVRAL